MATVTGPGNTSWLIEQLSEMDNGTRILTTLTRVQDYELIGQDFDGKTPLHHLISRSKTLAAQKLLSCIEERSQRNNPKLRNSLYVADKKGQTPFYLSIRNNQDLITDYYVQRYPVDMLVDRDLFGDIQDSEIQVEKSPLEFAISMRRTESALKMIEKDPAFSFKVYPLHLAISRQLTRVALALLPRTLTVNRDLVTFNGKTVLQLADELGQTSVAEKIRDLQAMEE